MKLEEIYNIIIDRKKSLSTNSYVASLFQAEDDRIIQKVGEEAIEVVIAAKNEKKERVISEVADLFFHILLLMAARNVSVNEIMNELNLRNFNKRYARVAKKARITYKESL